MSATIYIDPTGRFKDHNSNTILEACGLLPAWVMDEEYPDLPLREKLDKQYSFGLFQMDPEKCKVDENGVFTYPEDPDLYPYIKMVRGDEIFYQYQSGIVAIVQKNGDTFITRMD